jgi:hypothetical protein
MRIRIRGVTLLFVTFASLHGGLASARALTDTEVATLSNVNRDLLAYPAASALAETLGRQQNLDALPLLLEIRRPELMEEFVNGYRSVVPTTTPPPPELEVLALRLAHDPSFTLNEEGWDTRAGVFELLGNAI